MRVRQYVATRYAAPRNTAVPTPTIDEILKSGIARVGPKSGNPLFRTALYRSSDNPLPKAASIGVPPGSLIVFSAGLVFVPHQAENEHTVLKAMRTIAFTKLMDEALPELNMILKIALHTYLETRLFPEEDPRVEEYRRIKEGLEKYGMVCIPYVEMVEFEDRAFPKTFLWSEWHNLVFGWEQSNGQRTAYTLVGYGRDVSNLLLLRWNYEMSDLLERIKLEQVDIDSIWDPIIKNYQAQHGKEWVNHVDEMKAEANKALNKELEKKGFTLNEAAKVVLQRLAPVLPYYRQLPKIDGWVQLWEYLAGGGKDLNWRPTTSVASHT